MTTSNSFDHVTARIVATDFAGSTGAVWADAQNNLQLRCASGCDGKLVLSKKVIEAFRAIRTTKMKLIALENRTDRFVLTIDAASVVVSSR